MKILIIEDDMVLVKMYQKKLQHEGFEVEVAYSGGEGLAKLGQNKADLILLDIMMPAIDGFAVIKEIRKDEETRSIPIIILTNLGTTEIFIEEAKRLGIKDYLVKYKTSQDQLVEKVKEVLDR